MGQIFFEESSLCLARPDAAAHQPGPPTRGRGGARSGTAATLDAMTSVRDIVGSRHESAARLLLPIIDDSGRAMPWSTLISSARLTAKTSWADIRHLVGEDIDPPYACLNPETTELLTHALAQEQDPLCWFALWRGYAEEPQEQPPIPALPPDLLGLLRTAIEPLTVPDARPTHATLIQKPLFWLNRHAKQQGLRSSSPLLIYATNGTFTAACPIYHDSFYIGGSRGLIEQLIASSAEAFEIDPDSPIPGSGEILD